MDYIGFRRSSSQTRAVTLTEQLRKSYGGREDDFNSDSDDDTRPTNYGDYVESDGGREDDFNSDSDDERACTYIGDTNYVALTEREKGRG